MTDRQIIYALLAVLALAIFGPALKTTFQAFAARQPTTCSCRCSHRAGAIGEVGERR